MAESDNQMVKKTVVLHPMMDEYVRKTWAMLIENGRDATYSMAVNFMLLATIKEAIREEGLSPETRDAIWEYANDQRATDLMNLHDGLTKVREFWGDDQ